MSMLAERKSKQKWSLNPRGNDWSKDSSKFGQRMLEKMGWSEGKGLGANLNGLTEHIRVSYKNDSKGLGCKENSDQWTAHETQFNDLLKNLVSANGDVREEKVVLRSLEEKSAKSKARVHYKKFTRGKDLTRYSEKDLANIFGKKSFEPEVKGNDNEKSETDDSHQFGVQTKNGGSMKEYFKHKLLSFGKKDTCKVSEKNSDSEEELPSFGFGYTSKNIENNGIANLAFDPLHTEIKIKKHVLEPITETNEEHAANDSNEELSPTIENRNKETTSETSSERPFKTKSLRKKKIKEVCFENPVFEEANNSNESTHVESMEVIRKKKKRKQKEELSEETTEEVRNKKKKKRKNSIEAVDDVIAVDNLAFEAPEYRLCPMEVIRENPYQVSRKKDKKKRKKHTECIDTTEVSSISRTQNGLANPAFVDKEEEPTNECDIMLNVTAAPVAPKSTETNRKRKRVHFSNTNQIEFETSEGTANGAFCPKQIRIDEKAQGMQETIDQFESEVENAMNEAKHQRIVDEKKVVLKYEEAEFTVSRYKWVKDITNSSVDPQKSYKHLINGDVVLLFNNTNLDCIAGYGKMRNGY